jgi:hypothetical protein
VSRGRLRLQALLRRRQGVQHVRSPIRYDTPTSLILHLVGKQLIYGLVLALGDVCPFNFGRI